MKVYTKKGDDGTSGIIGGKRLPKDDIVFQVIGEVDELNAFTGVLVEELKGEEGFNYLSQIQHQLFKVGALLATATGAHQKEDLDRIYRWVEDLEAEIDQMDELCPPLTQFILPSGSQAISFTHVCRAICRRTERNYNQYSSINGQIGHLSSYLNRLSDYFFVLARRIAVAQKIAETPWDQSL